MAKSCPNTLRTGCKKLPIKLNVFPSLSNFDMVLCLPVGVVLFNACNHPGVDSQGWIQGGGSWGSGPLLLGDPQTS